MSERLCSVGLDVGTTSTQLIVSELTVENQASAFSVPRMEIGERSVRYRSPVYFTPLLDESHVDGQKIREIVELEYQKAGISRDTVDTGAIIITGETSRKENARAVLDALADLAGDFVVATAGPDLESILAAKGAGAEEFSRETGKPVVHMDIGGGTSNLSLIEEGKVVQTGCLNVGGRLVKLDDKGAVLYRSPVLEGLCDWKIGQIPSREELENLAQMLTQALEMAVGLRPPGPLLERLSTQEAQGIFCLPEGERVISFSGGVADCIEQVHPPLAFGDLGPALGQAIRRSWLCRGEYRLGTETIRATVIGAGCHATQLSGSTVFCRNVTLPLKNLPVVPVTMPEQINRELAKQDTQGIVAMAGRASPSYREVTALAETIAAQTRPPVLICLEQDMAKALGQALAARLPPDAPILCLDRVQVGPGSYLDIGAPIGGAFPVVVKTLVLAAGETNTDSEGKQQ